VIFLDTNVVSELLRREPDPQVRSWVPRLTGSVALTSATVWELLYSLGFMRRGLRSS